MAKLNAHSEENPGKRLKMPGEMRRKNKTISLSPETIAILDALRAETYKGYGILIDHAVAVVYGDPFDGAPPVDAPAPAKAPPVPSRQKGEPDADAWGLYLFQRRQKGPVYMREKHPEKYEAYEARYLETGGV